MMNGIFLSSQNVVQISCVVYVGLQFMEVKCIHKKWTVRKTIITFIFVFFYQNKEQL